MTGGSPIGPRRWSAGGSEPQGGTGPLDRHDPTGGSGHDGRGRRSDRVVRRHRARPADRGPGLLVGLVALIVAVSALVGLVPGGPVGAQAPSISRAEAADLARDAVRSDAALAELRRIRRIDDRAVDLAAVTTDLGADRAARLGALAVELDGSAVAGGASAATPPDEARRAAAGVLDDAKFHERRLPKPFKGILEWLRDRLAPVGRFLDDVFGPVFDAILGLPGGRFILLALFAGAVALATAWLAGRASRTAIRRSGAASLVDLSLDPADLDRRAEVAESAGDAAGAVRLRYEAGLLRLVRAGRLTLRVDTTAAGAAAQIGSPAMDGLTRDFEEIVYGGRAAVGADVDRSRSRWADLLAVGGRG